MGFFVFSAAHAQVVRPEENFLFFLYVFLFYIIISLDLRDNIINNKCSKVKQSVDHSMI